MGVSGSPQGAFKACWNNLLPVAFFFIRLYKIKQFVFESLFSFKLWDAFHCDVTGCCHGGIFPLHSGKVFIMMSLGVAMEVFCSFALWEGSHYDVTKLTNHQGQHRLSFLIFCGF